MTTTVWLTYFQKSPSGNLHPEMVKSLTSVFQEALEMKDPRQDLRIFFTPLERQNFARGGEESFLPTSGICRIGVDWMPGKNEFEKRRIVDKKLTQEMARILEISPHAVEISYHEISGDNYTVGGSRLTPPEPFRR